MTAKEKFQLGETVRPTESARRNLGDGWHAKHKGGVVTGFNRNHKHIVLVKCHTNFSASEFHMDFWETDT